MYIFAFSKKIKK